MLEFSARYAPPDPETKDWPRYLENVPTSLIAHELTHLTQTFATAAGVRQFLLAVEDLRLRSRMLMAAGSSPTEGLVLPICLNRDRYADNDEFQDLERAWLANRTAARMHAGGTYQDESDPEIALAWIDNDARLGNQPVPWEVSHFFLQPVTGRHESVMTGYIHLTEGAAKVVERIQRRLAKEEGEQAPLGTQSRTIQQFLSEISSPVDPYYIAQLVFWEAKFRNGRKASRPAHEEYVLLLADLAMMLDPLLTPKSFSAFYGGLEKQHLAAALAWASPFPIYLRLCAAFWSLGDELPDLSPTRRLTDQAVELQDALLEHCELKLTMKGITEECLSSTQALSHHFDSHIYEEHANLHEAFSQGFQQALAWRLEALRGGAVCEDLLVDRATLLSHVRAWSPSQVIGSAIHSAFDVRPGEGVGVSQANIQAHRAMLDNAFFGNGPCPLAEGERERRCALDPIDLCVRLPEGEPTEDEPAYCVREQFMSLLTIQGTGGWSWSPPTPQNPLAAPHRAR